MLNLDLTKSLAVRQLQKMAWDEGFAKGQLESAQEMLLVAIDARFGPVPKSLSNQIRQIKQPPVLKTLLRQVCQSQDLRTFKEALTQVKSLSTTHLYPTLNYWRRSCI